MNDYDHEDQEERNHFHAEIIGQMWGKIAGDIYRQYKTRGRGVLALFLMDDLPPCLKDVLPDNAEPTGRGAVGTYIPRDRLLPLENLIGEQGLLNVDRHLGEYDPETTIVFAFIDKVKNDEGKFGIVSTGYSVTPPARLSPRAMAEDSPEQGSTFPFSSSKLYNSIINLN